MNLCTNASHAMREKGGDLTVAMDEVTLDSAALSGQSHLVPGRYARLAVQDTGHGIPPDILDRIFEPYFTTKATGEGTGLGLAVVHGIVRANGGMITVETAAEHGTWFTVYFPTTAPAPELESVPILRSPKGAERILLVDDEPAVARMLKNLLETLGYHVESKTSGIDAPAFFRSDPEAFDLLVTDMTMPRITGLGLIRELREIRPRLPVILCTGFSEFVDEALTKEYGIQALIMKPVLRAQIAHAVRKALDSARDS